MRQELLDDFSAWRVPPPEDLPLGDEPHPNAEAREAVIELMSWATGKQHCRLAVWLILREVQYYDERPTNQDIAYSASRDAACWRLSCSEEELLKVLVPRFQKRKARAVQEPT